MRTSTGLNGLDSFLGQRLVAHQELSVLFCENIVCHGRDRVLVAEALAKCQHQCSLAGADRSECCCG